MDWLVVAAVAGAASLAAAAAMLADKRRAVRHQRRVPERAFVVAALAGGWPGIAAAGIAARHKTQARGFQVKVALAAIAHALVVWLAWRMLA